LVDLVLTESTVSGNLRRVIDTAISTVAGCSAASVSAMAVGAPRSVAVSDRIAVEVDLAQYHGDEGPCLDAARGFERVHLDVLSPGERFSHFAPLALQSGIRAVLSIPVMAAAETIGSLNLYSQSHFDAAALVTGDVLAAQVAAALAKSDILAALGRVARSAQHQSDDQAEIATAEGVLIALHEVSIEQAQRLLRTAATAGGESPLKVARRIIATIAGQPGHSPAVP
jgi:GAF domain-containing protein